MNNILTHVFPCQYYIYEVTVTTFMNTRLHKVVVAKPWPCADGIYEPPLVTTENDLNFPELFGILKNYLADPISAKQEIFDAMAELSIPLGRKQQPYNRKLKL